MLIYIQVFHMSSWHSQASTFWNFKARPRLTPWLMISNLQNQLTTLSHRSCWHDKWCLIYFPQWWDACVMLLSYNWPHICMDYGLHSQCQKLGKIFTGPTYKLHLSSMVISDVCRLFIPNKTTFTKHCLTQWISKLPVSFEIHCIRQYVVNFIGMMGIVNLNATVYKTGPIFTGLRHGK